MRRGSLWDYMVYVVVRLLICLAQAIDLETAQGIVRGLAWIMAEVLRVRGRVVEDNLRHAFPQQTARAADAGPPDVGTSLVDGLGDCPCQAEDP